MPTFRYVASSAAQPQLRGSIAADSPRHARDMLRDRGYRIEDIQTVRRFSGWSNVLARWQRVSTGHVATLVRELATLIGVGITLSDSLETLASQHQGAIRRSLLTMQQSISSGSSFAATMRQCPELFEEIDVSIAEMGESSGDLAAALNEIADFKESAGQFQDKVLTALLYPAIVLAMSMGVTLFLMTSVVPMLLETLLEADKDLPWATMIVKNSSDLLLAYWWLILLGIGTCFLALATFSRTERGRHVLGTIVLRIPFLGPLVLRQALARIAFIVATLIRTGVSLIDAIDIASRSVTNRVLQSALIRTKESLTTGRDLRRSLDGEWVIPPMVVQIFAVGQESGHLDAMLLRLSADYSRQVSTSTDRITRLLDPVVILVLAFFVGFIAFATILPIMEMGNVL